MTAKKKAGRSASTEAKPRTRGKSASAPEVWDLRLYVADRELTLGQHFEYADSSRIRERSEQLRFHLGNRT